MKHNFRVLLVDDEREFIESLAERLSLRGFDVDVARNGKESLLMLQNRTYDAMVLDLFMPELDGIQVLRALQDFPSFPPVAVVTGHGSASDRETCLELGAKEYMNKPVEIGRLVDALHRIMGVGTAGGGKVFGQGAGGEEHVGQ